MARFPFALLFATIPAYAAGLSDAGQAACYNDTVADGVTASNPASIARDADSHQRQDCRYGRDPAATAGVLTKAGAGAKGFDYSKLANNISPARKTAASSPPPLRSQIIVKFTGEISDPANTVYLTSLGDALGCKVSYVRSMSGGAHVLSVEHTTDLPLNKVLADLNKRADVSYAEEDSRMFPMQPAAPPSKIPQ